MSNNQILCFCTCSKNNKEHYLKNIKHWRNQILSNFDNIDLVVFSDGTIEQQIDNVKIINLEPCLGRPTAGGGHFPGWKRSFIQACKYFLNNNYKYFWHIENDIKLNIEFNKDCINNIKSYLYSDGLYISFCKQYSFLQSAFMILNDKTFIKQMIEFYNFNQILNETVCFEASKLRMGNWNIVFNSMRLQNQFFVNIAKKDLSKFDYFAQWNYDNPQL